MCLLRIRFLLCNSNFFLSFTNTPPPLWSPFPDFTNTTQPLWNGILDFTNTPPPLWSAFRNFKNAVPLLWSGILSFTNRAQRLWSPLRNLKNTAPQRFCPILDFTNRKQPKNATFIKYWGEMYEWIYPQSPITAILHNELTKHETNYTGKIYCLLLIAFGNFFILVCGRLFTLLLLLYRSGELVGGISF